MDNTSDKDKDFSNNTENQLRQQATQQRQRSGHIDRIEAELDILDDDYMMSSPFRICKECGNDQSFKPDFECAKTSIDVIFPASEQEKLPYVKTHQGVG